MAKIINAKNAAITLGIAVVILSICLVILAHRTNSPVLAINADCVKKYFLTSQTLDCDTYDSSITSINNLDQKLDTAVVLYLKEGKAEHVSVWVRDLTTLQWASTNETQRYAPASLMKVPLMISYFKLAQVEPSVLSSHLTFTAPQKDLNNSNQDYIPDDPLVIGKSYTVEQLIQHMILNSDNNATALLITYIDPTLFENTLVDLGLKIPDNTTDYDFVTAKSYGNIFRTLYNASYLNRNYSQKALLLLSQTKFQGLETGLPADVTVADKFGEREIDNPDGTVAKRELHDCGIIYKKSRPYTLCIMTDGSDFNSLLGIIHDLSSLTYQQL